MGHTGGLTLFHVHACLYPGQSLIWWGLYIKKEQCHQGIRTRKVEVMKYSRKYSVCMVVKS